MRLHSREKIQGQPSEVEADRVSTKQDHQKILHQDLVILSGKGTKISALRGGGHQVMIEAQDSPVRHLSGFHGP